MPSLCLYKMKLCRSRIGAGISHFVLDLAVSCFLRSCVAFVVWPVAGGWGFIISPVAQFPLLVTSGWKIFTHTPAGMSNNPVWLEGIGCFIYLLSTWRNERGMKIDFPVAATLVKSLEKGRKCGDKIATEWNSNFSQAKLLFLTSIRSVISAFYHMYISRIGR